MNIREVAKQICRISKSRINGEKFTQNDMTYVNHSECEEFERRENEY